MPRIGGAISHPNPGDTDTDRYLNPVAHPDTYRDGYSHTVTNGHRDPNTDAEAIIYAHGNTLTHHYRDTVTFGHPDGHARDTDTDAT